MAKIGGMKWKWREAGRIETSPIGSDIYSQIKNNPWLEIMRVPLWIEDY